MFESCRDRQQFQVLILDGEEPKTLYFCWGKTWGKDRQTGPQEADQRGLSALAPGAHNPATRPPRLRPWGFPWGFIGGIDLPGHCRFDLRGTYG